MDEHKKSTQSAREARRALMEQATRYRDARAEKPDAQWNCSRGHAWDDTLSAAQNVRCMNCAAQRREMHLRRLREIAEVRGGALLSPTYVDAATPLCWQCASGHVWKARAGCNRARVVPPLRARRRVRRDHARCALKRRWRTPPPRCARKIDDLPPSLPHRIADLLQQPRVRLIPFESLVPRHAERRRGEVDRRLVHAQIE